MEDKNPQKPGGDQGRSLDQMGTHGGPASGAPPTRQGPQPADQVSQRQQAIDGERAAPARDDRERIGGRDVGPPCWQREQLTVLIVQVNPVLAPVLPVRDELKVLAGQRMEPVRHPHTSVPIIRTGCS